MKVLKEAATVCEVPHPVKDKEDDICTVHLVLFANWLFLSFRSFDLMVMAIIFLF